MFADNTKICGLEENLESVESLQRDLDSIQAWTDLWQLKFNVLHNKMMEFYSVASALTLVLTLQHTVGESNRLHPGPVNLLQYLKKAPLPGKRYNMAPNEVFHYQRKLPAQDEPGLPATEPSVEKQAPGQGTSEEMKVYEAPLKVTEALEEHTPVTKATPRPDTPVPELKKQMVYGEDNKTVTMYANINSKEKILVCRPFYLKDSLLQRVQYKWTTANGKKIEASDSVSISGNGQLVFHRFITEYSGEYHCNTSYILEGFEYQKKYKFIIFGFHKPDWSLSASVEFLSRGCSQTANIQLVQSILTQLQPRLTGLGWEVVEKTTTCHWTKKAKILTPDPRSVIIHMDFIVFPYGITWEEECPPEIADKNSCDQGTETKLKIVYSQIDDFFKINKDFSANVLGTVKLKLLGSSLTSFKILHCKPGFGQEDSQHECSSCCVVCKPGTFSSARSPQCNKCPRATYSSQYGQVSCNSCQNKETTPTTGATSSKQCEFIGLLSAALLFTVQTVDRKELQRVKWTAVPIILRVKQKHITLK
ncbi:zona pellucida-binding protein 2-like isoform X2 [Erpetoichthys calabaricus]|uniref:zona pellucida-binding protein 2-like isoform X2 n=1 Tax=Erpetoichthys calabaricus TaxID=27687 RepID=UPI0022342093|nr:zona pellucida-binding protein 2-like isoform X2 [Erpetoichthys calabaricus]